jgi:hypothetical protein
VQLVEYVKLNPWKSERKYAVENSNTYFFAILQVRVKGKKVYSQSVKLESRWTISRVTTHIGELSGRSLFFRILYTTFFERCIGLPCGVVPRNLFSFLWAAFAPNALTISRLMKLKLV